jgi:hypothetical protein
MPEKTKYPYQGRQVDGQSVSFKAKEEQWSLYELEDGTSITVKLALAEVIKLDELNEDGKPIYLLNAHQVAAIVPHASPKGEIE